MDSPDKVRKTQAVLAALYEATPDYVIIADVVEWRLLYLNRAARTMVGLKEGEDLSAMRIEDIHPSSAMVVLANEGIPGALQHGSWEGESVVLNSEGREIPVSQLIVAHSGMAGDVRFISSVMRDLTERKKLEEQLRQAQKTECMGRLAGGVAHDFNNLLTVIAGYSEIALSNLPAQDPMRPSIQAISDAGVRAASLTRQLLTFSRQTVLEPRVLDLNEVVTGVTSILERVIGEDVLLRTVLDPAINCVKADPASIGQVLMNLAINASDAMPTGGNLTISTCNVSCESGHSATGPTVPPGQYVMLTTADTGSGMTPELTARIFEPFFTTKGVGRGTGLGLSVVHGIVKQSNGHIEVYSKLNAGTSFRIYLPAVEEQVTTPIPLDSGKSMGGAETILLVEDEKAVRALALYAFKSRGYEVLTASDGVDAMLVAKECRGFIDLLVTDVVMPRMGGGELTEALRSLFPKMKVLYTSGYTDDAVVRHGIFRKDVSFLQKPYTPLSLARKVRAVLDDTVVDV
jgi:two-component system cell cycle sensor histidine kinase/response regulator CckA